MTPPHLPALDGLRGLAVLGVLAFHAHAALPGGYLGVDLFFVLSGYLITGILVREHKAGGIRLGPFWIRRARRLLPALLVLMPAIAVYAHVWARPDELANLRADAFATLAYVANWRSILAGKSYWELFAAPSPLEHTWSLAIEEQFYLVWPLVVVALLRRSTRALLGASVALALASAASMLLLWDPGHTARAYLGSDTRAAAILLGAAFSIVVPFSTTLTRRGVATLDVAGGIAAVGLAIAWARLEGESPFLYRGGFWLTEVAALVLIACAVVPGSRVGKLLAFRPLAYVGTVSYGVYLWHWPVDVVLTPERIALPRWGLALLRLATTFAIALVSFYVVERPIRTRGFPRVLLPVAFAVGLGAIVLATRPRANVIVAIPTPPPPPVVEGRRWPTHDSVKSGELPAKAALPPGTTRILVLGDSVAQYLGQAMRLQQASAQTFIAERGVGSCSIHPSDPTFVNGQRIEGTSCASSWVSDVAELHPDVTMITLGGGFLGPRTCKPDWRRAYNVRLASLLDTIQADAGRIVLTLVPYPGERWRTSNMLSLVDCFNDELASIAKAKRIATLDLKSHVCPTTECTLMSNGWPVRNDGLHFDGLGAVETAAWTVGELRRMEMARDLR